MDRAPRAGGAATPTRPDAGCAPPVADASGNGHNPIASGLRHLTARTDLDRRARRRMLVVNGSKTGYPQDRPATRCRKTLGCHPAGTCPFHAARLRRRVQAPSAIHHSSPDPRCAARAVAGLPACWSRWWMMRSRVRGTLVATSADPVSLCAISSRLWKEGTETPRSQGACGSEEHARMSREGSDSRRFGASFYGHRLRHKPLPRWHEVAMAGKVWPSEPAYKSHWPEARSDAAR